MNFPGDLRDKCGTDGNESQSAIFVVIQFKEDMGSFVATAGQCIKIEYDGIEELAIVDCDDAPRPHPDERESSVHKVLAAAKRAFAVTGEFENIFDRSCYKTDDGKCLYGVRVEISVANLLVLNPMTIEELTTKSEAVKAFAAKIQEDIDDGRGDAGHWPIVVPKVFLSYSWDNDAHKQWVKALAARLRKDGIEVTLDQWETALGDQLPLFMEKALRESQFVLIICTPNYKGRSEGRVGGVGYEGDIMTAEIMAEKNYRKFIPVLRSGAWDASSPSWLTGKYYSDLSSAPYSEDEYCNLVRTVLGQLEPPPPIGQPMSTFDPS